MKLEEQNGKLCVWENQTLAPPPPIVYMVRSVEKENGALSKQTIVCGSSCISQTVL